MDVLGVERYNDYSGYGDSFEWAGDHVDKTPFDVYGRRKTTICVIDATRFSKPYDQYQSSLMLREINKVCNIKKMNLGFCGFFLKLVISSSPLPS